MSVFDFEVSEKEMHGSDAIYTVNQRVIALVARKIINKETTKSKIATRLGIHRSTVSRMLKGNQNLTARTIGELLGAIDCRLIGLDIEDMGSSSTNSNSYAPTFSDSLKGSTKITSNGSAITSWGTTL